MEAGNHWISALLTFSDHDGDHSDGEVEEHDEEAGGDDENEDDDADDDDEDDVEDDDEVRVQVNLFFFMMSLTAVV